MKTVTLEHLSDYITGHMDVSDRFLCTLIGITPAALSSQKKETFESVAKNKVGRRVGQIFYVVHYFVTLGLSKEVILDCLRTPAFQDLKDNFDSVSTAIQQDKYETEVLVEIGKLAYQEYQRKADAKDDLFPVVKELMAEAV